MSRILPELGLTPYIQPYVGSPNDAFANTLYKKIDQYDIAKANNDMLGEQAIRLKQIVAPLEGDQKAAGELFNKYTGKVNELGKAADFENAVEATARNARAFTNEIQPLMENYKRYSDFHAGLKKDFEDNKIDLDTYKNTIEFNKHNNKGIDLNNVQGTMFQGFHPGQKYDLTKFIDEMGKGWESAKSSGYYTRPDGSVMKVTTDKLPASELAKGLQYFVNSNANYQSYKLGQHIIGLKDKTAQEESDALLGGIMKYSKNDITTDFDAGYTKYLKGQRDETDYARMIGVMGASASVDPNAINKITASGFTFDNNGDPKIDSQYIFNNGNGKYYRVVDKAGNPISKAQLETINKENKRGPGSNYEAPAKESGFNTIELTPEQIEAQKTATKELIINLKDQYSKYNDQLLRNPATAHLAIGPEKLWSKKFDKVIFDAYNENMKNSQVTIGAQKIQPNVEDANRENGVDRIIADNLLGRTTNIISAKGSEAGINSLDQEKGQDWNAIQDALQKDGWHPDGKTIGSGVLVYNPYGGSDNEPAVNVKVPLKNSKNQTKIVELSANMLPTDPGYQHFKVLNKIMSLGLHGESGDVKLGGLNYHVDSSPDLRPGSRFNAMITVTDTKSGVQHTEGIDTFAGYFTEQMKHSLSPEFVRQIFGSSTKSELPEPRY